MPSRSLKLKLDDWLTEEFSELQATYPSFSEEELALILIEHSLGNSDVLATIFAPFAALARQDPGEGNNGNGEEEEEEEDEESCGGRCKGTHTQRRVVDGECPEPCDPEIVQELTKAAKKEARRKAIAQCMEKHEDCICAGGRYDVDDPECNTQTMGDTKMCVYKVKVKYKRGTCRIIA